MITKTATIPKFISSVVTSKLFGIISFTLLTVVAAQITIPVLARSLYFTNGNGSPRRCLSGC